jgi:hypothetical protein
MSTAKILAIRSPCTPETFITPLDSPTTPLYHIPSPLTTSIPTITLTRLEPKDSPPPYTPSVTPSPEFEGIDTKITYLPFLGALLATPDNAHPREVFKIFPRGDGEVAELVMSGEGEMKRWDGGLVAKSVKFRDREGAKTEGLEIQEGKVAEEWAVAVWVAWLWVLGRRGEKNMAGKKNKWWKGLVNPVPWLQGG